MRERIPACLFWHRRRARVAWYSVIARVKCLWWGVALGYGCIFDGPIQIFRCPGSEIRIGNNCRFNGHTIATQAGITRPCTMWTSSPGATIRIGNGCGFSGTAICCHKSVVIGDNVRVGSNVTIMDSDQHIDDPRVGPPAEVVIHDDVWLGSGSSILKGVTIGMYSVIALSSVVTRDIPDHSVAAGVPAKVVRDL